MLNVMLSSHLGAFQIDLSFQVPENQTTVILGESGAGKSTLLRYIAGLYRPLHGHLSLNEDIYYDSARHIIVPAQARPFGFVFQDYVLFPHLTAYENVAFGLRAQHKPARTVRQQVMKVLEQVQMIEYAQHRPDQLSGGQQQRIALARALVLQPRLLLLDEPLSALDVQTRRTIRQELRQILATASITTLFVTHHYLDSLFFGQQILVIDHGKLIQQGDQRQLSSYPRSSYIAELVGVNLFTGHIRTIEDATTCVVSVRSSPDREAGLEEASDDTEELTLVATIQQPEEKNDLQSGTQVFVVIEPRSITLHRQKPEGSARNIFQGTIQQLLYTESASNEHSGHVRVSLHLFGLSAPLIVEVTAASVQRMDLAEGQSIYASCKASEVRVYD